MFKDRKDAAIQLGKALDKYKNTDAIVLGIPKGGAEMAYYVAYHLKAELSLIISIKLGHPINPEYAVGAISEDESLYLNPTARTELSQEVVNMLVEQKMEEIKRRVKIYRDGEPLPDLQGKTVILVDDGITTGATVFSAVSICKSREADKIVVAAPVSGHRIKEELEKEVDEVVILEMPEPYFDVSQVYTFFRNLTEEEALEFMENWKVEQHG